MISISVFGGKRRNGRRSGDDRRRKATPVENERRGSGERRSGADRRSEPRR
jgi:hypothetical protein